MLDLDHKHCVIMHEDPSLTVNEMYDDKDPNSELISLTASCFSRQPQLRLRQNKELPHI